MEALDQVDNHIDSKGIEESDTFFEMEAPFIEANTTGKDEKTGVALERTRRGSTCKQIRPLSTFVKPDTQNCENDANKMYIQKVFIDSFKQYRQILM
jgi:hypothetical protein